MKYAWISEYSDSFPVSLMCEVLDVSPSGYYDSLGRRSSARAERHERIKQSVQHIHAESHGIYGSYKIAAAMQKRDELESACRNTVAAAMREMGLKSRVSKAFTPTTTQADPAKRPAENKLNRDFTANAPNRKWVTDITYLPTATGWVYLAVVLDLFSRKVVGWSIGTSLATELVSDALRKAITERRPNGKELLHHSDRGCQYTSNAYQKILRTLGIECSMAVQATATIMLRWSGSSGHSSMSGPNTNRMITYKKRGWVCSSTSKRFTIQFEFTRHSDISHQTNMKPNTPRQ